MAMKNRPFDQYDWVAERWIRFRVIGMSPRHGVVGYRMENDSSGRGCTWRVSVKEFRRRIMDGDVVMLPPRTLAVCHRFK